MSEKQWQDTVVRHARQAGWIVHFVPDRLYRKGFKDKIPMDLGDRGYPDLTLVSIDGQLLYRELKSETGTLSDDQKKWRDRLVAAGADWDLWKPRDLDSKVIPRLWATAFLHQ